MFNDKLTRIIIILGTAGSLLLFTMFIAELKGLQYIGRDVPYQSTIVVSGEGESFGTPDIAEMNFAISHDGKTVGEAQTKVNEAMAKVHKFLSDSGIEEKDIKTTGYNVNPRYEWQQGKQVYCISYPCPPIDGKQILIGYTVTQSVDVKVRDIDTKTDQIGKIITGLGDSGVTNLNGPYFTIEDPDALKAEARAEAIAQAKTKAEQLSKDLGVKLVRIVSFNEGGDYGVYNYGRGGDAFGKTTSMEAAPVANIPVGENKMVSNVTITYEIR